MLKRGLVLGVVGVGVVVALSFVARSDPARRAFRGYATTRSTLVEQPPAAAARYGAVERGAFQVMYGDFGLLTTDDLAHSAVPWKLLAVLPDLVPEPFFAPGRGGFVATKDEPLRRFGMIYRAPVDGLPPTLASLADFTSSPVGYVRGTAHRRWPTVDLEIAAGNCSMCHVGRRYDAQGMPTERAYWGAPNHSLDLDALVAAITSAVRDPRASDAALTRALQARFPGMEPAELETYTRYVLPAFRKAVDAAVERWGALHPWSFGGPGLSNGIAILREQLVDVSTLSARDFGGTFAKIPTLFSVTHKERILIDGSYVSAEPDRQRRFANYMVGFLPVLGVSIDDAIRHVPELGDVYAFLQQLEPPKFPGPVDELRAARGQVLYAAHCAACHGDRDASGAYEYPSRSIAVRRVGTDATRARGLPAADVARFNASAVGAYMHVESTDAYVAPSLRGVWTAAPYFHNGSVPTLWHVLNAEQRPRKFWSGGNALDLKHVGIAGQLDGDGVWTYPAGYVPWSEPRLVDTSQPGHSAEGHAFQDALSADDKWALVEYLKTL